MEETKPFSVGTGSSAELKQVSPEMREFLQLTEQEREELIQETLAFHKKLTEVFGREVLDRLINAEPQQTATPVPGEIAPAEDIKPVENPMAATPTESFTATETVAPVPPFQSAEPNPTMPTPTMPETPTQTADAGSSFTPAAVPGVQESGGATTPENTNLTPPLPPSPQGTS
ncbi:hypothetical protein HY468_01615 [Candidatus Roizmanbacteria bacterium]|nr:hypothetical protein [Candidatus Roizmanbacteria bacterium]